MWEKLKGELATDRTFYALLIVLVGLSAFALGRYTIPQPFLGGGEVATAAVSLTYTSGAVASATESTVPEAPVARETGGAYVASRSGTKYHDVRCSSAGRIAEANRVYFQTEAAARAAGYTPAATCPLLTH
jgi:hypothetical protein